MSAAHLFTAARHAQPRHFAAHSHHLWPDVTAAAHDLAWQDAIHLADHKWDEVFAVVFAEAQAHVAGRLALPDAATIALAPNTHELVTRLVSSLPSPTRILTTDGEFHSFRRQADRWVEAGAAEVTKVPVEPFADFPQRFGTAIERGRFDLVYVSHVMFDSGYVVPALDDLVAGVADDAEIVFDGYHGFMALPTDLSSVADRVFYVSGGYKYAMAGEGACFMHCPPDRVMRPVDTGWYAGFAALEDSTATVGYGGGGARFFGATFDPTPWYRFNAVQRMLNRHAITVADIHGHVRRLQERFLDGLPDGHRLGALVPGRDDVADRGHFLTFRSERAAELHVALQRSGVVADRRGDRLRLGFGLYHEESDIDTLVELVAEL